MCHMSIWDKEKTSEDNIINLVIVSGYVILYGIFFLENKIKNTLLFLIKFKKVKMNY